MLNIMNKIIIMQTGFGARTDQHVSSWNDTTSLQKMLGSCYKYGQLALCASVSRRAMTERHVTFLAHIENEVYSLRSVSGSVLPENGVYAAYKFDSPIG